MNERARWIDVRRDPPRAVTELRITFRVDDSVLFALDSTDRYGGDMWIHRVIQAARQGMVNALRDQLPDGATVRERDGVIHITSSRHADPD